MAPQIQLRGLLRVVSSPLATQVSGAINIFFRNAFAAGFFLVSLGPRKRRQICVKRNFKIEANVVVSGCRVCYRVAY